jgi:adenylate cyclase
VLTLAAKYILEEHNKKFLKVAFSKYVAPSIVNRILEDPTKLMLGGEKKELTILFSDIRGFTTFSEKMDAKQLATFLNDYLGIMTNLVFANDGTLDKYIGDAVMAFWGAPLDQAAHADHCLKAAIAMMKALSVNQARFVAEYGVDVRIGIGVNTGVVNVGNMGSVNNFEYTVIGDHVNLASRLEGLTKHYGVGILTTRFTLDQVASSGAALPAHRVLDFVKVKGKGTAVELIQVLDRDLSPEGLKLFAQGRAHYSAMRWDAATEAFGEASRLLSTSDEPDAPCEMYLERCRDFRAQPPEPGWDGSWTMTSK